MRKLWTFNGLCALLLILFALVLLRWHHFPLGNLPPDQGSVADRIGSVAAAPSQPPAPSIQLPGTEKPLSLEEFRALGVETLKGLPSRGDLQRQRVKDEFLASAPVLESAKKIERLSAAALGKPELEAEALLILQDCSTNDSYLSFVRALCFSSFRAFSKKMKRPVRSGIVPGSVRELADQLEQ
jgi:hypothetical protein